MKRYLKIAKDRKAKTQVDLKKEYELDIDVQDIAKDPEKFLDLLRSKITATERSIDEIFKGFDKDGDGIITFEEFREAMLATKIKFSEQTIKAVFKRFDQDEGGTITYVEFLSTIFAKQGAKNVFDSMRTAEGNFYTLKTLVQAHFKSWEDVDKHMFRVDTNKLTEFEFKKFIQSISDTFSKLQLKDVFEFLDVDRKGFLDMTQMKRLYLADFNEKKHEPEVKKEAPVIPALNKIPHIEIEEDKKKFTKSDQKEILDSMKLKSAMKSPPGTATEISLIKKDKVSISDKSALTTPKTTGVHAPIEKVNRPEQWERFIIEFSNIILRSLRNEGKSLRDIFNIFSKQVQGELNQEEFLYATQFILGNQDDPGLSKSFFNFYVVGFPRRMNFKLFSHIIFTGKKGSPLYMKIKNKCKQNYDKVRKGFLLEFQKADSTSGKGLIAFPDFKALLANFGLGIDDNDARYLSEEECLISEGNKVFCNYEKFMRVAFPESDPIKKEITNQAAKRVLRFLRTMHWKKKHEKTHKRVTINELRKGSTISSKSKRSTSTTKGKKVEPPVIIKEELSKQKPKELFELNEGGKSVTLSPDKTQGKDQKKAGKSTAKKKEDMTLDEKMKAMLPVPTVDDKAKERAAKVEARFRKLIYELVDQAVGYGESLKLSREIQGKYESRPVLKDVFITLQDLELEVVDPLPRSLCISSTTGRIGYMDKDGNMEEYDLANNQTLKGINLGSKIPLKRSKVIDFVFDNRAGRIYTLTDSWMLEVWELHQDLSIPVNRLKIISEEYNPDAITNAYQKRYGDVFPQFITLSTNTHQLLIVNSTCINNSVVFVDPVSVSIFSQVYLKQDDYKLPGSLNKILFTLKPLLDEMSKRGDSFETVLHDFTSTHEGQKCVSKFDFTPAMRKIFGIHNIPDREGNPISFFLIFSR